jgi:hypothetical protein
MAKKKTTKDLKAYTTSKIENYLFYDINNTRKMRGFQDIRRDKKRRRRKKKLSFSLIERVILSAGAMLIFSVSL